MISTKWWIKKSYFLLKSFIPIWRLLNIRGVALYTKNSHPLSKLQLEIVQNLRRDGIAISSLSQLFPGKEFTLEQFKNFTEPLIGPAEEKTKKKFYRMLWDAHPVFNLTNPFAQFSIHPTILDIGNAYMGMWSKLKLYMVAVTTPVFEDVEATQSQRWHRDPEEKRMFKVFIYLSDVDKTAGPFIYIKGSISGSRYGYYFPQHPPAGNYPPNEAVEKLLEEKKIDPKDMLIATGQAGTVIFCDTTGLHKGGYATGKERIMATMFYASSTYSDKRWYKLPNNWEEISKTLPAEIRFALKK